MAPPGAKQMRRAYGFDEVAIVPGDVTINPELVDVSFALGDVKLRLPFLAAGMDAVVDPRSAAVFSQLGGLAVLNVDGLQTRYEDPESVLREIAAAPQETVGALLQRIYSQPVRLDLVGERVRAVKREGALCAISCTPANAKRFAPVAVEAGVDVFVVQSTVTTARHSSRSLEGLRFDKLCEQVPVPVIVGNTVSFGPCKDLMETGIAAVLIGVGPSVICTTRDVLGIGVPQVTAIIDCAAARDAFERESGRYVPIIADGGIHTGGDLCKAFAAGADAAMLGTLLAVAEEAPGRGYHWGMSAPHAELPRGKRVHVGVRASLEKILYGPTSRSDGTENLAGVLRTAMGVCGASTVREFHQAEMVIAPSIKTEGKTITSA
ncbi:MAG: GuaB3 family IMP dehydrogenase-related protein [Dehalococcoidia bacterium]